MIRIVVSLQIQPGRGVKPIKPLLAWELNPGLELSLPAEIEAVLIREGLAKQVGPAANTQPEGK